MLQPRLPGNPGDGTCSLQLFLKPIKVFPGALELGRAGEPKASGFQCSPHSQGCPLGTFPALPLGSDLPSSMENAQTGPDVKTDFCSLSFTVPLCFRVMLLKQKFKKCNVLFHEKSLSRDLGSKAIECCSPNQGLWLFHQLLQSLRGASPSP